VALSSASLAATGTTHAAIARIQTPVTVRVHDSRPKYQGKRAIKTGIEFGAGYNREVDDITSSGNLVFTARSPASPEYRAPANGFA
jgi:hypothetical protein